MVAGLRAATGADEILLEHMVLVAVPRSEERPGGNAASLQGRIQDYLAEPAAARGNGAQPLRPVLAAQGMPRLRGSAGDASEPLR